MSKKTKLKARAQAQKHGTPAAPAVLTPAPAPNAAGRMLIEPTQAEPSRNMPVPERKVPTLFRVWAMAPFAMMDMWFAVCARKRERA